VHLGHQRAGGVDHLEAALHGQIAVRGWHSVGGEDQRAARWYFVKTLDEHGATVSQIGHDLMAHDGNFDWTHKS
jgi:hypothetical protein